MDRCHPALIGVKSQIIFSKPSDFLNLHKHTSHLHGCCECRNNLKIYKIVKRDALNFLRPEFFVEPCSSAQGQNDFSSLDFRNLDVYCRHIAIVSVVGSPKQECSSVWDWAPVSTEAGCGLVWTHFETNRQTHQGKNLKLPVYFILESTIFFYVFRQGTGSDTGSLHVSTTDSQLAYLRAAELWGGAPLSRTFATGKIIITSVYLLCDSKCDFSEFSFGQKTKTQWAQNMNPVGGWNN